MDEMTEQERAEWDEILAHREREDRLRRMKLAGQPQPQGPAEPRFVLLAYRGDSVERYVVGTDVVTFDAKHPRHVVPEQLAKALMDARPHLWSVTEAGKKSSKPEGQNGKKSPPPPPPAKMPHTADSITDLFQKLNQAGAKLPESVLYRAVGLIEQNSLTPSKTLVAEFNAHFAEFFILDENSRTAAERGAQPATAPVRQEPDVDGAPLIEEAPWDDDEGDDL